MCLANFFAPVTLFLATDEHGLDTDKRFMPFEYIKGYYQCSVCKFIANFLLLKGRILGKRGEF